MIADFEKHHGVVLTRLVRHGPEDVAVRAWESSRSGYVVNDSVGLYVKYSTKRLMPWVFTLAPAHLDEISALGSELPTLFIALLCGPDGIALISGHELDRLVDSDGGAQWLRVEREPRGQYAISGSGGRLTSRVPGGSFPARLFQSGAHGS